MHDAMRNAIDTWFDHHREELLEDIRRLVAVKSVREAPERDRPYGPGPAAALRTASEILKEKGFAPVNFENRVVTADMSAGAPVLGILAHVDTVDFGDGWTSDPLTATVRDGNLYGRGAADDKGPAVAAIYALAAAKELAPGLPKGCRVLFGSAEETGHDDLYHYRQQYAMPPSVFTPDGEYPVINAEKGRLVPTFTANFPESALPRVMSFKGGVTANAVPEHAEAVVEGLTIEQVRPACAAISQKTDAVLKAEKLEGAVKITSDGKAAHAMEPHAGINAQTALLELLEALPLAPGGSLSCIKKLNTLFPHGDTNGTALGIAMADELAGPLTLNFGVLSMDSTGLTGNFDARTPKCATTSNMDDIAVAKLMEAGFDVKDIVKTDFHHTPADMDFVRTLLGVYETYSGRKGACLTMGGQTYVHDIDGGVCFGCVFPGVEPCMHGADEFIPVDDLILSAKMFTQIIIDMCR